MFRPQSLALYKNRPVLVLEIRDRIEIRLEDGSVLRVRDKDLVLLHEGPVKELPSAAQGGDFETARRMLSPAGTPGTVGTVPWTELAELVFGQSGPSETLACWLEATKGILFRIEDGNPLALDDEASARETQKKARKEGEAAERAAFVERAKRIKTERRKAAAAGGAAVTAGGTLFEESDGRYLSEIEALAYGKSEKSKACAELGISETPEAAHALLLALGRWDEMVNPHPLRALCPLSPPKVELEIAKPGTGREEPGRVDLTSLESWAIDNAWSKDPDDAIAWDGERAWIHVADPASAILPDSAADKEALARGSTLYLPELISPMLPDEALRRFGLGFGQVSSLGLAVSLLDEETRETAKISPALSFRIDVAEDGSISSVEAMASTVRVRRCSYGEADRLIEAGAAPSLAALSTLAARRIARRVANGAIEIDIPEVRIIVEGEPGAREIRIEAVPRDDSSALVREMMLLAGEAAARWAFERSLAFPFYGQEAPSDMGPQQSEDATDDAPRSLAVQFARRRLMRSGMWGPSPSAHRGLGLPFYAQVTSPLRRYQDILGHMQLRAFLSRETDGAGADRAVMDADEVSRRCALAQAASAATRQAERASNLHWTTAYLVRHPDWVGDGIIVGSAGPGAWQAYLPELGLETRLRLGPDRSLDERVKLRLVRADVASLESSFEEH